MYFPIPNAASHPSQHCNLTTAYCQVQAHPSQWAGEEPGARKQGTCFVDEQGGPEPGTILPLSLHSASELPLGETLGSLCLG